MRFMDDESITGPKEFAVGNYLVQTVSINTWLEYLDFQSEVW